MSDITSILWPCDCITKERDKILIIMGYMRHMVYGHMVYGCMLNNSMIKHMHIK